MSEDKRELTLGERDSSNNIASTDAVRFYDNANACLICGYWRDSRGNNVGTLKIAPAFTEKQDGGKTYNYEKTETVFFTLSTGDCVKILRDSRKLLAGKIDSFAIRHMGERNKTALLIGNQLFGRPGSDSEEDMLGIVVNLYEFDDNLEVVKDLYYEFKTEELQTNVILYSTEKDFLMSADETGVDSYNVEFDIFLEFVKEALRVSLNASQHIPGAKSQAPRSTTVQNAKQPRDRRILSSNRNSPKNVQKEDIGAMFAKDDDE
jgi:hypothetical protein